MSMLNSALVFFEVRFAGVVRMLLVSAPVGPYSCVTIVFRSIASAIAWRTLMSFRNGCWVPGAPRSPFVSLVVSANGK